MVEIPYNDAYVLIDGIFFFLFEGKKMYEEKTKGNNQTLIDQGIECLQGHIPGEQSFSLVKRSTEKG